MDPPGRAGRTRVCRWLAVGLLLLAQPAGAQWQAAKGPLTTRWGREVTPENAHREYPRPQLVRPDWLNLNGLWDYAVAPLEAPRPDQFAGRILVPFPVEAALSGVMRGLDEKSTLWYRRRFEVPAAWRGKRMRLHFGAVDWAAQVFVNGSLAGFHRGGYDAFSLDITRWLTNPGPQELVVAVTDPTEASQPRGKQSRKPQGIFYTPTSGIWQTVWLEPLPEAAIEELCLVPDLDERALRLRVIASPGAADCQVEATALAEGRAAGRADGEANADLVLPLDIVRTWSPAQPFLYDLRVVLKQGGQTVDEVAGYFGLRQIAVHKDKDGANRVLLNHQPLFLVGVLDQGFWPDGLYTAPSDEASRSDVETVRQLGFNLIRKHVKVEPERWYYWCDKLGVLVWQDMPSGNNNTDEARRQFEVELLRMIQGRRNHPSIIQWVIFNEGWGQYDTERLAQWVKTVDPSRLVDNASGWTDKGLGDVLDMHSYPGPGTPVLDPIRASVLGEFGGLGLAVKDHTWSQQDWGYQRMADAGSLLSHYRLLLKRAWSLAETFGLSAAVYTQLSDIETECNGLLTYDRALVKVAPEGLYAANRGEDKLMRYRVVAPCAVQAPIPWRYSFDTPPADWYKPAFDDAAWRVGMGGFGTAGTPGAIVRTEWKTADIWLRRIITLEADQLHSLRLQMHHDEDAEVYLNGILAASDAGFITDYTDFTIADAAAAALRPGTNTLAIHCHQTIGGQYIDAGIWQAFTEPKPGGQGSP